MATWAGANAPTPRLQCAVCLVHDDVARDAVTQVDGTLVCQAHVKWMWTKPGE